MSGPGEVAVTVLFAEPVVRLTVARRRGGQGVPMSIGEAYETIDLLKRGIELAEADRAERTGHVEFVDVETGLRTSRGAVPPDNGRAA